MVKCLKIFLFVLKATASALEVRCFSCWSNLIQSRLNPNPNPNPKTAFFKKDRPGPRVLLTLQ